MAIWQNAKILWGIESNGDSTGAALSAKWESVVQWTKRTHKKQVKADAKLVLATRLCLEEQSKAQSSVHQRASFDTSPKYSITPQTMLNSINSLEFWCLTFLNEYCGASNIAHGFMLPFIHKLLCPQGCGMGAPGNALTYRLNDQNTFSKQDSMDIAKNLCVHFHKYKVATRPKEKALFVFQAPNNSRYDAPTTSQKSLVSTRHQYSHDSSPQSFFDDDDENNIQVSNTNLSSHEKRKVSKNLQNSWVDSDSTTRFQPQYPDEGLQQQVTAPSRSHNSPRIAPTQSRSPERSSRIVDKNNHYLRSHRVDENHLNYKTSHHDNPNDISNMSSVVDARSPPRRQPHPYPAYSPHNSVGGRYTDGPSRSPGRRSHQPTSLTNDWQKDSALDYKSPLNDTRLSINELDESLSRSNSKEGADPLSTTRDFTETEKEMYDSAKPKYNNRRSTEGGKRRSDKKTPPKELYDRNGHRIRGKSPLSKSKSQVSTQSKKVDERRKSYSAGDSLRSSRQSSEDGVAFGRRLTHCERAVPEKESTRSSALSCSAESIIDKDPDYA